MQFTPDVIVTTDYSPSTIALVAEAKRATVSLEEGALRLKQYMLRTSCPVGIIVTPEIVRIYKNRFVGRSEDSIEPVGEFPSSELFRAWQKPAAGAESALESALVQWLDELARTAEVRVSDPGLKRALEHYVVPAVSGGHVSIAHPGN